MSEFVTMSATVEREGAPVSDLSRHADVVRVPVLRIERSTARRHGAGQSEPPATSDDPTRKSVRPRPEADHYAYVGNGPVNLVDPSGNFGQVSSAAWGLTKAGAQWAYGAGSELLGYALDTGAPELQALAGLGRAAEGLGIGADVFDMAPFPRGVAIEQALGQNLAAAFPTIDNFTNGVATSIKSLDLNAATYQNGGALASRVNGYVDSLANFNGARYGGVTVNGSDVASRVLQLAVPNSGTAAQQAVLQAAAQRAAGLGVQLNIINLGP